SYRYFSAPHHAQRHGAPRTREQRHSGDYSLGPFTQRGKPSAFRNVKTLSPFLIARATSAFCPPITTREPVTLSASPFMNSKFCCFVNHAGPTYTSTSADSARSVKYTPWKPLGCIRPTASTVPVNVASVALL